MTRKDFVLIAETINTSRLDLDDRIEISWAFAHTLATTNPRFDRARFFEACMKGHK